MQHRILAMLVKLKPNFAWCWCELDLLCPTPSPTPSRGPLLSWGPATRPDGESPGAEGPTPASAADYKDISSSATAPRSTAVRETNSKKARVWLIFLLPTSFGENQKESLGAVNLYLTNPYRNRQIREGPGAAAMPVSPRLTCYSSVLQGSQTPNTCRECSSLAASPAPWRKIPPRLV